MLRLLMRVQRALGAESNDKLIQVYLVFFVCVNFFFVGFPGLKWVLKLQVSDKHLSHYQLL